MQPAGVDDRWSGMTPRDVIRVMVGFRKRWWIAGGWALDLYLGGESREHADIDISCFRSDVSALRTHLDGWECYTAVDGVLSYLDIETPVPDDVHTLWSRERGAHAWGIELMIEDTDGPWWTFRRNPEVRRLKDAILWQDARGLFVLRPEVQLLYKAADVRLRDQTDFERVLPALDDESRAWLTESLRKVHRDHPWLHDLEEPTS